MISIEKSINVDVPLQTAYNQWTQFEEFPLFMEGVKEVKQLDPARLHWRADVLGKEVEWTAEITRQIPDREIAWHSTDGAASAGRVSFTSLGPARTQLTLRIDVEPEGAVEKTGGAIGLVSARVEGDLKEFKKFIEERGVETGQWRGEIRQGRVDPDGN
jgi:uncharacterized membrane protein